MVTVNKTLSVDRWQWTKHWWK